MRLFSLASLALASVFVGAQSEGGYDARPDGRNAERGRRLIDSATYAAASDRAKRAAPKDAHQSDQSRQSGKRTEGGPSFGSSFVDHFSAQTADISTYLYDLFNPSSNTTPSLSDADSALSYSVTRTPAFYFQSYLFSPENAGHVHITPITTSPPSPASSSSSFSSSSSSSSSESEDPRAQIIFKEYIHPRRRRDGPGGIGIDVKFGGWRVEWRGVEMEVWGANWIEGAFMARESQTHIIVNSLPSYLSPSPSLAHLAHLASLSSNATNTTATTSSTRAAEDELKPSISADLATSLFILEVNEFVTRLGEAVLVFDDYWQQDRELWESADWKDVILDEDLKKDIIHEYKSFYASEEIYKSLGVPWKRGMIYLGPPGNGKTISLKATMKDVGVPLLYVKSFHTWGGDEMGIQMIFDRARQEAPCLLIMEDLDSLITEENRSFFLNQLDGITDNDGLLLIGTTNHFDKLDPAVSNRPSRFDRKYNFPNPNAQERYAYAIYWQDKLKGNKRVTYPDTLAHEFANKTDAFSFAYMKEAFVSTLLLLAGDETKELEFPSVLLKQVSILRKELDAGNGGANASMRNTTAQVPIVEAVQKAILPGFSFWRM